MWVWSDFNRCFLTLNVSILVVTQHFSRLEAKRILKLVILLLQNTSTNDAQLVKRFVKGFYVTFRNNALTKNNKYYYLVNRKSALSTREYTGPTHDKSNLQFFVVGNNDHDKGIVKAINLLSGQSDRETAAIYSIY